MIWSTAKPKNKVLNFLLGVNSLFVFFLNQIFANLCSYSVSKALLKKHTVWGAEQRNLQVTCRVKWSRADGWMDDLACSFHTEAPIKLLRRLLYLRTEREGKCSLIFQTTCEKLISAWSGVSHAWRITLQLRKSWHKQALPPHHRRRHLVLSVN